MGFWQRESKVSEPGDYAWAHDGGLGGGTLEEIPAGTVLLSRWSPQPEFADGWHGPEREGRWTTGLAVFPVSTEADWAQLTIHCINHHPIAQAVDFALGSHVERIDFEPREEREVIVPRVQTSDRLTIACTPVKPSTYGADDGRELGIFVKSIELI